MVPIILNGRYFWRGVERFLIRGVCYTLPACIPESAHSRDPIRDSRLGHLQRDIDLFQEIGLNCILVRVWKPPVVGINMTNVSGDFDILESHEAAMALLEKAGIYVVVVLPARSPNGIEDLDSQKIYSKSLLESYFKKVDLLAVYSNILGVIADSETIDSLQNTRAAPCIRALVSDLKRYMRVQVSINNQRILPVGVQAADMMTLAIPQVMYMTAGSPEERVDFYCHNNYHWASPSDMQTSGWNQDVTMYSRFPVPMFISEYGTKVGRNRSFQETTALYSPAMTRVFSGGFVWEFLSLEEHELSNRGDSVTGHGIVRINTKGEFLRTTKEFRALKKRLKYVMNPLHASYKKQGGPAMEFGETDVHDLGNDILDTEDSWRGSFPQVSNQWQPRLERMPSLLDWMSLEKRTLDHQDTEWVIVEKMSDLLLQTEQYENE